MIFFSFEGLFKVFDCRYLGRDLLVSIFFIVFSFFLRFYISLFIRRNFGNRFFVDGVES